MAVADLYLLAFANKQRSELDLARIFGASCKTG
jgi:hypothetical protein